MMEPTDNELHAGCVGNINATWTFHGPLRALRAALGRPTTRSTPRRAASPRWRGAEREEHVFDGLTFYEVASVTEISGGIAMNVIPDPCDCDVNYRFAPGRTPAEAEARLRELRAGRRADDRLGNSPSGAGGRDTRWRSR